MAATQNFGNMTDLEKVERHRASFNENIAKMQEAVSKNSKFLTRADHDRKVARLLALNNVEEKATLSDMNLTRSLAVLNIESNGNLVQKLVKRGTNLRLIPVEDLFDVLMFEHGVTEHGGQDIMHDKTSKKYANVTVVIIKAFLQSCLHCCLKKSRTRKNLVVKPIISPRAWHRWQTDLIDMQSQPDGEFKYIQVTQDHFSKFCFLQPLKQKTANQDKSFVQFKMPWKIFKPQMP